MQADTLLVGLGNLSQEIIWHRIWASATDD